jgi:hypothetical protein
MSRPSEQSEIIRLLKLKEKGRGNRVDKKRKIHSHIIVLLPENDAIAFLKVIQEFALFYRNFSLL